MNPSNEIIVDDFRFISHLHTTARQLHVCTHIIKTIGNKQLPKDILTQLLLKWSVEEEKENASYKSRKGKLTEEGKPTTAVNHYLGLCDSLGLITNLNYFYAISRISYLILYFSNNTNDQEHITKGEKAFYLFILLYVDADGMLLILQMLNDAHVGYNQKDLQSRFKDALNLRLTSKQNFATIKAKDQLGEKYRAVNFTWKNAAKYAEHLIVPRCEWLNDIGLIEVKKAGSGTQYVINNIGINFYAGLINIPDTEIKDINEIWLNEKAFSFIGTVINPKSNFRFFKSLDEAEKKSLLGRTIRKATEIVKTSAAFRYSLLDTLLFISLEHLLFHNIITEFTDSLIEVRKGVQFEGQYFTVKESGRINENYISVRPI